MVNYSKDDFDADTLQSDTPAPSPIPSPYPANNRRSHVPEQCPDFQTTKKVSLSSAATTPSGFVETVPKGPIKRLGATSAISFDPKVLIQPKHAIKAPGKKRKRKQTDKDSESGNNSGDGE
ncbi:hypothetical protein PC119_g6928 [Phytophthora cactorum]|uniref:Uncharacterized protein n=1 Tax=Phytophthora cactorum TaxID=29920 RepID=A0A8T0Z4T2_9STRA|nr:hypothetical protein PC113_g10760 [Phytophthora cactorum]KAG3028670.1 hypothetical protein PC119_g6928 [Phytophthora cactorum]